MSRLEATLAEQAVSASDEHRTLLRAVDQELGWYFSYAENAKRVGHVTLLPTAEAAQLPKDSDAEAATLRRALELATTVQVSLDAVPTHCAGVLRAVYTPRRWPASVTREFRKLTPVAVRLVCSANPWPERSGHDGLEHAAARHLERMLARETARPATLRNKARRLVGNAITAYVKARAKGGAPFAGLS